MFDIRKILEKVVKYEQDIKEGKKSKMLKVSDTPAALETIYIPKRTW